eukprot:INCI15580.1.p1 GENE.INCI15580.1~~INCI15580.1.p1  ORF type:complete len:213 (+),score=21.93 INCI15580.1:945-1583(+)
MRLHYLQRSQFFAPGRFPVKVLTALTQAMLSHHFSPGDTLYHQGSVPLAQMYFVHSGVVESRLSMDVETTVDSSGATQRHFIPSTGVHAADATRMKESNRQGWNAVKNALKTFKFGSIKKTSSRGTDLQDAPRSTTTLVLCTFEQGSCFGEFALMLGRKAHTSTTASMYCEVQWHCRLFVLGFTRGCTKRILPKIICSELKVYFVRACHGRF